MGGTGLVILAAGGSTRLGRPKQLLPWRGQTLIEGALRTAVGSPCDPVVVVLGAQADRIQPQIEGFPATLARHPDWSQGLSSSLRLGLKTLLDLRPDLEALVVMLCDQPLVTPAAIARLVATHDRTQQPIVACQYAGRVGVPALFARRFFPRLAALEGDRGARAVVEQFWPLVARVPCPEAALDIDTPRDWAQLQSGHRPGDRP